jgi:type II secretory pathway pseudopilin PulG
MFKNKQGFSLFEMLIVLAFFFIAAAVAIPQIQSSVASDRLLVAADELAAEINLARTMAVSRNTTYEIQFTTGGNTFQVIDPEDPENPPRARKSLGPNVVIAAAPGANMRFFARGHCSGGSVMLISGAGSSCTLRILPTGHVQVGGFESYEK